ncbi:unnamed protein product [Acanthosepion pharaonis]|uniref:Uncharacterized protein n=1 Tax=Acanthosepion pharaonis TaxID=158019 RepID=A0A812ECC3_ACAPH|nr:unnamed protein product [Sepia pharaonis]
MRVRQCLRARATGVCVYTCVSLQHVISHFSFLPSFVFFSPRVSFFVSFFFLSLFFLSLFLSFFLIFFLCFFLSSFFLSFLLFTTGILSFLFLFFSFFHLFSSIHLHHHHTSPVEIAPRTTGAGLEHWKPSARDCTQAADQRWSLSGDIAEFGSWNRDWAGLLRTTASHSIWGTP